MSEIMRNISLCLIFLVSLVLVQPLMAEDFALVLKGKLYSGTFRQPQSSAIPNSTGWMALMYNQTIRPVKNSPLGSIALRIDIVTDSTQIDMNSIKITPTGVDPSVVISDATIFHFKKNKQGLMEALIRIYIDFHHDWASYTLLVTPRGMRCFETPIH